MKIILEIPDSDIPKKQEIITVPIHFIDGIVCGAGGFGFDTLPKGHGKLKDVDWIEDNCKWYHSDDDGTLCYAIKDIDEAPTIIEADKEVEHEDSN